MTTRLRGPFIGQDKFPYHPHQGLVAAANTALILKVPLLLTGEPGCGKTDFAWAAARALGREPLCCYVRSDTRARDLFYHYDAVRRFADVQGGKAGDAAWPHHYIDLMPLGEALLSPEQEVVLIDEIDKAPRDLPNDLLWEIDRGHFEITEIGKNDKPPFETPLRRRMPDAAAKRPLRPLIIITSNVERQLPDAFLRRCVFYHIPFPAWSSDAKETAAGGPPRKDTLENILRGRLGEKLNAAERAEPRFVPAALQVLRVLREEYKLTKKPATAELLHWIEGLLALREDPEGGPDPVAQLARIGEPVDFSRVPGLYCLLKLREDLVKVGLAEEGSRV